MSARKTFARFSCYARGGRRLLVLGALLLLAEVATEVTAIWTFARITDEALVTGTLSALWPPALIWFGATVTGGVAAFAGRMLTARVAERFLLRLRDSVYAHVQRLSPDVHQRYEPGDLVSRHSSDIDAIERLIVSGMVQIFVTGMSVVVFVIAALRVNWQLALTAFALTPLFLLVARSFSGVTKRAAREEREANAEISSAVEEGLANHVVVQAYNARERDQGRLHERGVRWLRARLTESRVEAAYTPLVGLTEVLGTIAVLALGTWQVHEGGITLGGLISLVGYLGYLYPHVQELGHVRLTITSATASAERIAELLDTPITVHEPDPAPPTGRARGSLWLHDVGFRYPGSPRPALRDVSFGAEPGQILMVTGASGAGKSTIAKLLLRFYDPEPGAILLDGVDIRTRSLHSLRANVTLLPQETALFTGTVRDNLRYGNPDASDAQVVEAARAADAHDFIAALPDGYDTDLSRGALSLSGGQRQRLAIARAMLRNTPVLVLDEPTTGLDDATAARVMAPLRRLMAGRTTIVITHDLRFGAQADRVVVLHDGQLAEIGTHRELLDRPSHYRSLREHPAAPPQRRHALPRQSRSVIERTDTGSIVANRGHLTLPSGFPVIRRT